MNYNCDWSFVFGIPYVLIIYVNILYSKWMYLLETINILLDWFQFDFDLILKCCDLIWFDFSHFPKQVILIRFDFRHFPKEVILIRFDFDITTNDFDFGRNQWKSLFFLKIHCFLGAVFFTTFYIVFAVKQEIFLYIQYFNTS